MCIAKQVALGHGCQQTTILYLRNPRHELFHPQGKVPITGCIHCRTVDGSLLVEQYLARFKANPANHHLRDLTAEEEAQVKTRAEQFRLRKEKEEREAVEHLRRKKLEAERRTNVIPFPVAAVAAGNPFGPRR